MKIIALEESFWYDKLATDGSTAQAWRQLKSAVAADWQRKLVDFTEYRLPDMDRNGVDMQVVASREPAGGGGSLRHALTAAAGLAAMAAWPTAARQRGPSVPWALRPRVSAAASVLLFSVLLWFGAELIAGGALEGLAERVLGGTLTLWPLLVVLSCRRGQARRRVPRGR